MRYTGRNGWIKSWWSVDVVNSVVSDSIRGEIHIFILSIGYASMPRILVSQIPYD